MSVRLKIGLLLIALILFLVIIRNKTTFTDRGSPVDKQNKPTEAVNKKIPNQLYRNPLPTLASGNSELIKGRVKQEFLDLLEQAKEITEEEGCLDHHSHRNYCNTKCCAIIKCIKEMVKDSKELKLLMAQFCKKLGVFHPLSKILFYTLDIDERPLVFTDLTEDEKILLLEDEPKRPKDRDEAFLSLQTISSDARLSEKLYELERLIRSKIWLNEKDIRDKTLSYISLLKEPLLTTLAITKIYETWVQKDDSMFWPREEQIITDPLTGKTRILSRSSPEQAIPQDEVTNILIDSFEMFLSIYEKIKNDREGFHNVSDALRALIGSYTEIRCSDQTKKVQIVSKAINMLVEDFLFAAQNKKGEDGYWFGFLGYADIQTSKRYFQQVSKIFLNSDKECIQWTAIQLLCPVSLEKSLLDEERFYKQAVIDVFIQGYMKETHKRARGNLLAHLEDIASIVDVMKLRTLYTFETDKGLKNRIAEIIYKLQ